MTWTAAAPAISAAFLGSLVQRNQTDGEQRADQRRYERNRGWNGEDVGRRHAELYTASAIPCERYRAGYVRLRVGWVEFFTRPNVRVLARCWVSP